MGVRSECGPRYAHGCVLSYLFLHGGGRDGSCSLHRSIGSSSLSVHVEKKEWLKRVVCRQRRQKKVGGEEVDGEEKEAWFARLFIQLYVE
ncbi:hypothetical protein L484_019199 [Morus notabilis]|uniref:Uncharacterized protein n=1 Tax=Morus notabilis TaxID=981085 RepID=W9QR89_9ROSA|nr:hypothetical protein L484_019199 [Morus notabilis]